MSTETNIWDLVPQEVIEDRNPRLPVVYANAKLALEQCDRIDECKDWADKAQALSSYAKQADDDSLRKMSDRIKARAIRRCGELLKEIEAAKNHHDAANRTSRGEPTSRSKVARDAGLSRDQQIAAIRVASVPKESFESQVESDNPPTLTELAEQGTKKVAVIDLLQGRDPKDFQAGLHARAVLEDTREFCQKEDFDSIVRGSDEQDRQWMIGDLVIILEGLGELKRRLI